MQKNHAYLLYTLYSVEEKLWEHSAPRATTCVLFRGRDTRRGPLISCIGIARTRRVGPTALCRTASRPSQPRWGPLGLGSTGVP